MRCVQPKAAGFYDPNQQQPCVTQQMHQLQQGTSVYNQIPQVQPRNNYTVNSNYTREPQHYDTSFSALPDRRESPWQKVAYKKRPRDNPENLTQNIKQIKLNDYWLNQTSPLNTNRFDALREADKKRKGYRQNETPSEHHQYLWQESKISSHSKN
jgi:hypothetical protein